IADQLAGWGFNSARMTFAQRMVNYKGTVPGALISANPGLSGATPFEVYQACVKALTDKGIIVIPNMHLLYSGWCCSADDGNGLPYNNNWPISGFYNTWSTMAATFADNPLVAAFDLYNEPRTTTIGTTTFKPSWGDGVAATDMRLFYGKAASAIQAISPEKIVICEGTSYASDLRFASGKPVAAHNVVYSGHDYSWFHDAGQTYADYKTQMDASMGYLVRNGIAPLWIGEFGINTDKPSNLTGGWWSNFMTYTRERNLDVCLWHLDGTLHVAHEPVTNLLKAEEGQRESFSLYASDWMGPSTPTLLTQLQGLM
ncbi:MAG TPA: cellulase family glycosylhydrolase, partial [Candidatus Acidoferrum sp.]|nr:cellulase family glycosylhydrolase [Candidatus Acidoferrum sp.]